MFGLDLFHALDDQPQRVIPGTVDNSQLHSHADRECPVILNVVDYVLRGRSQSIKLRGSISLVIGENAEVIVRKLVTSGSP